MAEENMTLNETMEEPVAVPTEESKAPQAITIADLNTDARASVRVPDLVPAKDNSGPQSGIVDIVRYVLLGITMIALIWAGWMAILHNENAAKHFAEAADVEAAATLSQQKASQELLKDEILWDTLKELKLDIEYAEKAEDDALLLEAEWKLEQMKNSEVSEKFEAAISWAEAQRGEANPFAMEGYVDSYYEEAATMIKNASAKSEMAAIESAKASTLIIVVLAYSVIAFLLAAAGIANNKIAEIVICSIAAVGMVLCMVYMFTIPAPTDFNLASYFKF